MAAITSVHSDFYRRQLSPAEGALYDGLLPAILEGKSSCTVNALQVKNLGRVIHALVLDWPETFFWKDPATRYSLQGGGPVFTYRFELAYRYPPSECALKRQRVKDAAQTILRGCEGKSAFERLAYLYDVLAGMVSYGTEITPQQYATIEGPLLEARGICSGIARAFKYLANLAGVSCLVVHGRCPNPKGVVESHAWNIVQVDGHCHHVDATWGNQQGRVSRAYLALSDTEIQYDHTFTGNWPQPGCSTSRCPLPTANGIPALAEALLLQKALGLPVTELRVTGVPGDNSELLRQLGKHCSFGKKGRCFQALKGIAYNPSNRMLYAYWKKKGLFSIFH